MNEEFKDSENRIIKVDLEQEMKTSYIDYAMSVIVSRALPDVRDGFKPVHRRILFGMNELGNTPDKPYKKSARIVGDVMGKYHPHGDSSIYMALVRMAQDWSMRNTLVDPHGNFGSVDGDGPAAMRYTEARLAPIAMEMLADIKKETVDMTPNYDNSEYEPTVLPTRIPNLLVNGAAGIAVGMATNMAPHNLTEVMNGVIAYIEKRGDITTEDLMKYVKAPDFPTGGVIYGYKGVREAYETGRGSVIIRGKAVIESTGNHDQIIITEIPYGVVKKDLVKAIADLATIKRIEGISNIQDESSAKTGMRIVIDLKRDANAGVVLNKLYKMTALQSSFACNNIALVDGRPRLLSLKELIGEFVKHRHEVVTRRTRFDLRKAKERLHILEGRIIAADNIDEVVHLIKASANQTAAMQALMERFSLSEIQARSIVEMRLGQLTGLELDKLHQEYDEVTEKVRYYERILSDEDFLYSILIDECREIIDKYGDDRRSEIVYATPDMNPEDFYPDDDMIITISHYGYIKRTPLAEYRSQNRGGTGAKGAGTKDEDFVEFVYGASNHAHLLFFTDRGRCYWLRVFEIPEAARNSKGRAIQNILNIESDNRITAILRIKNLTSDQDFVDTHYLNFVTEQGMIRKARLRDFSRPRAKGIIAIRLKDETDRVVSVMLTNGRHDVLLASREGRAIRFPESLLRPMGRTSSGVRGMRLQSPEDRVVGAISIKDPEEESILVVSENGYGKRSPLEEYRITNRGGKGIITLKATEKTGKLIAVHSVTNDHDIMIINKSGVVIRVHVSDISILGRNTQGIRLINLSKRDDEIADVCRVPADEDQAEQEDTSIGEREEDADPTTLDEAEEPEDDTPESEED